MTRVEEIKEEESEDDFEIISKHEEDQEEAHEQEPHREEVEEEQPAEVEREVKREEPVQPPPPEVVQEGRKIYVTKTGIKYHLTQSCDTLKGYRSYEKRA